MIGIITIKHSATLSLAAEHKNNALIYHFGDDIEGHCVDWYTTYRDPYQVAASWANRYSMSEETLDVWKMQWGQWKDALNYVSVVPVDTLSQRLNSQPDKYGLYDLVSSGKLSRFHEIVPLEFISFAKAQIKESGYAN